MKIAEIWNTCSINKIFRKKQKKIKIFCRLLLQNIHFSCVGSTKILSTHTHTHTHTYIYIYIYISSSCASSTELPGSLSHSFAICTIAQCFRPYFSCNAQHILFVLHGWFTIWEVSSQISAILWDAFSPSAPIESRWYIHLLVLTQPQLWINLILFYQKDQIFMWSITCEQHSAPSRCLRWHRFH